MDMYLLWERSKGVIMAKKQLKPCEPPSSQKKHRNWRRCRWQFNTICCAYVDESAMDKGFALYRDRDDISNEECKNRFLPIDNKLANGEEDYCRCAGVFVEMKSSTEVKRSRRKGSGEVDGYTKGLFEDDEPSVTMVQRPEGGQYY